ncbi:MAG: UDP-3-O-(3-hydroxymyristoyl)glucosamine N-acyltransferase [Bacteroidetes bacterium]|nr:UDP-3-O-(3-hydroxymyristoyl)glucosamine N-acyltransferase [Bacteroidota bacterium]
MKLTTQEIATQLGGTAEGPDVAIRGLCKIEEGAPGLLSFLHAEKYFPYLYTTQASAVLVPADFRPEQPLAVTLIRVSNPYFAFSQLLHTLYEQQLAPPQMEHPHYVDATARLGRNLYLGAYCYIGRGAEIGDDCRIYPNVYIGDGVKIGANTILYPNTVVYHACEIGANCILHSGVVVGSDGFGFLQNEQGTSIKVPQIGNVVIEDDVEIGANTVVDRATLGSTRIQKGVKLDNLIQIAHNTDIGAHTVIAAQAGVSGSSKVGKYCMIGGQTGMVGHIHIADRTQVGAKSGLSKNIDTPGTAWRGAPAHPLREQMKMEAALRQLPDLLKRVNELEAQLAAKKS